MELLTARFVDQLFSSPNEIMVTDQLAEWNRQHLGARYALTDLRRPAAHVRSLRVVAARGFAPEPVLDQFADMPIATSGTARLRTAHLHAPILVPDVTEDGDWTPYVSFSDRGF